MRVDGISTQQLNELVVLVTDATLTDRTFTDRTFTERALTERALTDALLDLDEDPRTLQMLTGHPRIFLGS